MKETEWYWTKDIKLHYSFNIALVFHTANKSWRSIISSTYLPFQISTVGQSAFNFRLRSPFQEALDLGKGICEVEAYLGVLDRWRLLNAFSVT